MSRYRSIIVLGPTASGKTKMAVQLAAQLGGEILSIDSRQVYRHLDIGTGKDYADYTINGRTVPHHLIDIAGPGERLNVFDFVQAFNRCWDDVVQRQQLPVLCGGTGLYYDVLLKKNTLISVPVNEPLRRQLQNLGLDELAQKLRLYKNIDQYSFDFSTTKRLVRAIEIMEYLQQHEAPPIAFRDIRPLIIGTLNSVEERRHNISQRLAHRLDNGLVEEARQLLDMGITHAQLQYFGLEYKFLSLYLQGQIDRQQMFKALETAIHQYARRQMTWFRKMEREGFVIHWLHCSQVQEVITLYRQ